jgi:hypothetical protein
MEKVLPTFADARESLKGQDWGIASAIDDIRHKVIEEGWYSRPTGRAVTDYLSDQPSPMQSLYQSYLSPEQERGQEREMGAVYGRDISS